MFNDNKKYNVASYICRQGETSLIVWCEGTLSTPSYLEFELSGIVAWGVSRLKMLIKWCAGGDTVRLEIFVGTHIIHRYRVTRSIFLAFWRGFEM